MEIEIPKPALGFLKTHKKNKYFEIVTLTIPIMVQFLKEKHLD